MCSHYSSLCSHRALRVMVFPPFTLLLALCAVQGCTNVNCDVAHPKNDLIMQIMLAMPEVHLFLVLSVSMNSQPLIIGSSHFYGPESGVYKQWTGLDYWTGLLDSPLTQKLSFFTCKVFHCESRSYQSVKQLQHSSASTGTISSCYFSQLSLNSAKGDHIKYQSTQ